MNIGEKDVSGFAQNPNIVLNMKRELKIIAPVPSGVAVVWENRIVEKDFEAVEVNSQPVEHNDIWSDDEEIARERRIRLIELVKKLQATSKEITLVFPAPVAIFKT